MCLPPPKRQRIGATTAVWFETEPGIAFIHTADGSPDDRVLAEVLVREQLRQYGIKQAQYTFEPGLTKEAAWTDIEQKAKRLIQSGNVTLLRNGRENVVGHVIGDHGEYQTEISREDPNSMAITQWQCECPWDQFAFQRTRQWKKYEGRPCAHVLATWWVSKTTKLDEEMPEAQGQGQLFPAGPSVGVPRAAPRVPQPVPQGQQLSIPGVEPGTAVGTPPGASGAPPAPQVLPQFPGTQEQVVNPASVPGLRQPTPTNPIQYPGGTFSSVPGDWQFEQNWEFVSAAGDTFQNSDMVRINVATMGIAEGKSKDHGAGQYREIKKNSIGEVLGQDPTTGWVDVIFPLHKSGPMEPYHVRAWLDPSDLTPMPGVKKPGPFIKRRTNVVQSD